jgi:hypothetical protein
VPLSSVPTTSAEVVIVGVDTHKDVHVAVALGMVWADASAL